MFLKPFKVKSHAAIKGTDRKKWRSQLEEKFLNLPSTSLAELVPNKGDITVAKLFTHNGAVVNVFCLQKNPLFFEIDQAIYPTVYVLWKFPDILPAFTTAPQVIPKLCGGADLMLPGVILPNGDHEYGPHSFGNYQKGDPCAVNQITNRAPVAVGKTALSSSDMFFSAKRGKGVIILHTYMDNLWAMGDKTTLPELPPPFNIAVDQDVSGEESDETKRVPGEESVGSFMSEDHELEPPILCESRNEASTVALPNAQVDSSILLSDDRECEIDPSENVGNNCENVELSNKTVDTTHLQFDSMDQLMTYCFLKAWKTSAKKVELPLLTSTFYATHMLPCVPRGHVLDLKKSSFKKLSKFLQAMQEQKFLQVKELTKGVESIVDVNLLHPQLRQFVVDKDDVSEPTPTDGKVETKIVYNPPVIDELYLTSAAVLPLFKLYSHGKGSAVTASDVRQILTNYVKDNNLQNMTQRSIINLDPILAQVLLTKNENNVVQLKWDEANARCLNKMNLGYRISVSGQEPKIHKGGIEPIKFSIAKRAANKTVTLVTNLETYGIDPRELAHTVQIGVAASTSIHPATNAKQGSEVLIQGNQVKFLAKLLLDEYKIPRKYIKGLELLPKKGRK